MGDPRYTHEHHVSEETVLEQVVNTALGTSNAGQNTHTHTVRDSETGETGKGSGTSASQAKEAAMNDLNRNR